MKTIKCSFCGTPNSQVKKIITGGVNKQVAICDECANAIHEILMSSLQEDEENNDQSKVYKPSDIKKYLDQYVIAQDIPKRKVAVAVYNHFKQNRYNETKSDKKEPLDGTNILVLGASGSGKTLIFKTIAKMLSTIFVHVDCSALTETGYVGRDVDSILAEAVKQANGDIDLAQKAIIFLDEFDKLARKSGAENSATKDVGGESVQQGMLKILEGTEISISLSNKKNILSENVVTIDTSNMLFVLNGAFEGLDKIIAQRLNKKSIGFGENHKQYQKDELLKHVNSQDLINFGILPEVVARAPSVIVLDALTENDLIRILTEPKNAIVKQYIELFKMDNVQLTFKTNALKKIAKESISKKLNARGLRAILDSILSPLMFDIPNRTDVKEVIISDELKG